MQSKVSHANNRVRSTVRIFNQALNRIEPIVSYEEMAHPAAI